MHHSPHHNTMHCSPLLAGKAMRVDRPSRHTQSLHQLLPSCCVQRPPAPNGGKSKTSASGCAAAAPATPAQHALYNDVPSICHHTADNNAKSQVESRVWQLCNIAEFFVTPNSKSFWRRLAVLEGFHFWGCKKIMQYCIIVKTRMSSSFTEHAARKGRSLDLAGGASLQVAALQSHTPDLEFNSRHQACRCDVDCSAKAHTRPGVEFAPKGVHSR